MSNQHIRNAFPSDYENFLKEDDIKRFQVKIKNNCSKLANIYDF